MEGPVKDLPYVNELIRQGDREELLRFLLHTIRDCDISYDPCRGVVKIHLPGLPSTPRG